MLNYYVHNLISTVSNSILFSGFSSGQSTAGFLGSHHQVNQHQGRNQGRELGTGTYCNHGGVVVTVIGVKSSL